MELNLYQGHFFLPPDGKQLKHPVSQTHFAPSVLWNDVFAPRNTGSKPQFAHLWMNELYHPSRFFFNSIIFFPPSTSLKFKCWQWSKRQPSRKRGGAISRNPPRLSAPPTGDAHSSSAAVTQLQQLAGAAEKCHQGAEVFRPVFFSPHRPLLRLCHHAFYSPLSVCPP